MADTTDKDGIPRIHQRKTTLLIEPRSPNLQKYVDTFGHDASIEAQKFLTTEEIEREAAKALLKGEPIPEWRDRHKTRTGTSLDILYGLK